MHAKASVVGGARNRRDVLRGTTSAAVPIVRVLETHEGADRKVDVCGPDRFAHLLGRQEAAFGFHRPHLDSPDERRAPDLVVVDVGVQVEDDLLTRLGLGEHRDEVSLRARRHVESGLLACPLGGQGLQALDGRILSPHIVADLGSAHRLAHLGRRGSEGVGAEVDDVVHSSSSVYFCARRRWAARRP
jgi:hypothetical protein